MTTFRIFDADQTAGGLPFPELIEALKTGFAVGCQLPERHHHTMKRSGEADATLLLMPAWSHPEQAAQYLGVKLVTVVPGNASRRLPGLVSTYMLYDGITGEQLALMDGNTITGRRTVATLALAAGYLSRTDSSKLLVIGAGRVGSLIPEAYCAVRPIREVAIWDVDPAASRRLAESLSERGLHASVADDLSAAVQKADIVSAATLSTEALIRGEWLAPGTHVDLIGAFTPTMREADDATISKARLYVDTPAALHESGDLVQPIDAGVIAASSVRASLADLCREGTFARTRDSDITCFKSVGSALADLVAAQLVYRSDN